MLWIVVAQKMSTGSFFATFCFDTWQEATDFWRRRNKGYPGMCWSHVKRIDTDGTEHYA